MKLLKLIRQPNQTFASVFLAFSLFGFFHPHHANSANKRYHVHLVNPSQVQQNSDDQWYTPPRSPGFNDLTGS
ncbi:MAG: hypothetical protein WB586_06485 [Chthoniobacterales bacterium]